jgi:hypothetical protein
MVHSNQKFPLRELIFFVMLFQSVAAMAQSVGINTDGSMPDASAILDLSGDGIKGLLLPVMTTSQRNASNGILSPDAGIVLFDQTLNCLVVSLANGKWKNLCSGEEVAVTTGTTTALGQVGIGTTTPDNNTALDIVSDSKGVLLPKSTADLQNIKGMLYFNTTSNRVKIFDGNSWVTLTIN